jgi:hypothetical protein
MQRTFGYQTGDAPDQRRAKNDAVSNGKASKAEYNVSNDEGNRRLKPTSTPANSPTKASNQTKENYSSITDSKVKMPDTKYKSSSNNTSTAFSAGSLNKKAETLAEKIRKRRMGQ